ncbi:MAG TPA: hypothetical protein VF708_02280 [Pyrinomonadaceae bacterium]|jgi:hypothetical protein
MRRWKVRPFVVIALIMTVAIVAIAAVNIKRLEFTDNGTTLTTCGTLTGLGNQDVTITVNTQGIASTVCTNRGGNNPPGQQVPVSPLGSVTIPATEIKNGNVRFCVTTKAPTVTAEQAGCPSPFTAKVTDVRFTSATVTAKQGGQVVLQQTFSVPQ